MWFLEVNAVSRAAARSVERDDSPAVRVRDTWMPRASETVHVGAAAAACGPTPMTRMPAASPAAMPLAESSTTMQRAASTPSAAAPARKPSGSGLLRETSAAAITTGGIGSPAARMRAVASSVVADVTSAYGTPS
jgi:hypothetical protein